MKNILFQSQELENKNMQLKAKTIKELQEIMRRDYSNRISKEDANELGSRLLRLTRLVLNMRVNKVESEK